MILMEQTHFEGHWKGWALKIEILLILARMWAMLLMLSMPCSIFFVMLGSGVGSVTVAKMGACSEKRKEERRKKVEARAFNNIKV